VTAFECFAVIDMYRSGEPLLFRVDVVNNFAVKESMVKDNSIREQMFASIASWLSSELSQKQWCHQQGIAYHIFHYWYRKYRDEHQESTGSNSFVQLAVKPEPGASCEVIFRDGTKIIFQEAVPAQYLKTLLF
jgi:hypothetical protein